ncbi:hypothetical protein LLE49_27190 [Alicyclobacillus tolerans]|nr:hypothetical protein [Alicyclobacillus tolerans]MCF8568407.1 hypothetical protein [Alicyclobacillus tolerans]
MERFFNSFERSVAVRQVQTDVTAVEKTAKKEDRAKIKKGQKNSIG